MDAEGTCDVAALLARYAEAVPVDTVAVDLVREDHLDARIR